MTWWPVIVLVGLVIAIYVASLWLHPFVKCPLCNGSGRHRGLLFSYAHRPCRRCGGSTRQLRLGRQFIFGPPQ